MTTGKANPRWKEKILEWKSSGKSIKSWCLENNTPITTFYGWKTRLEKSSNQKFLVKPKTHKQEFVELKDQQESCKSSLTLEYEGFKIHLHANFDSTILKQCLDCLRDVSC